MMPAGQNEVADERFVSRLGCRGAVLVVRSRNDSVPVSTVAVEGEPVDDGGAEPRVASNASCAYRSRAGLSRIDATSPLS